MDEVGDGVNCVGYGSEGDGKGVVVSNGEERDGDDEMKKLEDGQ